MYWYSITYLVNSLGFFCRKNERKVIKLLVLILLIFLSGTRYYMGGSDVFVYENVYNGVPSVGVVLRYMLTGVNLGVNENYEVGYLLICSIIKSLHFSYFGFLLVFTCIFYVLMVKGLEEFTPSWSAFFAVFMYKLMFYNTFISIRQGFTMAVFCCSLKYLRDNKPIKYFLCCYIAFLIHRGAIFLFVLYFVRFIPVSKKTVGGIALAFLPTWFIRGFVNIGGLIDSVISIIGFAQKSEGWAELTEPISIIHTLECYIVVILVVVFFDKIMSNKRKKEATLAIQLFMAAIPIFTLLSNWIVMTRVKDYVVLMYGVLFGYMIDSKDNCVLTEQEARKRLMYGGRMKVSKNRIFISLGIVVLCYIGMMRYVMVFDGGVLKNFVSFLFVDGTHIFR